MKKTKVLTAFASILVMGVLLTGCTPEPEITRDNFGTIAQEKLKTEISPARLSVAADVVCLTLRKEGDFSAILLELSRSNNKLEELEQEQFEEFVILAHENLCSAAPFPERSTATPLPTP